MIQHSLARPRDPKRVIVLGASGFVGRHLMTMLSERGIPTCGPTSREIDLGSGQAPERLRRVIRPGDAIVFAAALTPDRGKELATLVHNLKMAEAVARALPGSACDHMVVISSDAVYDDRLSLVRETSVCQSGSRYGQMHLLRERVVAEGSTSAGCALAVVRPCALYGVEDTHNSYGPNRFVRSASDHGVIHLVGNGEEKRDHLAVTDLTRLLMMILEHRSVGTLNAATGTSVSFGEIARLVATESRRKVHIEHQPRNNPITHRHFDISARARSFPSFRPVDLRTGLAKMVAAGSAFARMAMA